MPHRVADPPANPYDDLYDEAFEADEREFQALWGPLAHLRLEDVLALLDGFPEPWWIGGGWAVEAFTGVPRRHEDVDVIMFRSALPAIREHFRSYHVWAVGSGTLRPLTDDRPDLPDWAGQVWLRRDSSAPWEIDIVLNDGTPEEWIFKRDPDERRTLAEVTWVAPDGIRYATIETVLAGKAKIGRPKDHADFRVALPHLDPMARTWLRDFLRRHHPGHDWLDALT